MRSNSFKENLEIIICPFLFLIFPILSVYSSNFSLIPFGDFLSTTISCFMVLSLIRLVTFLYCDDQFKGAVFLSYFISCMYCYGPMYWLMVELSFRSNFFLWAPRFVFVKWFLLFLGCFLLLKRITDCEKSFKILFQAGILLCIISSISLLISAFRFYSIEEPLIEHSELNSPFEAKDSRDGKQESSCPDVYLIIADSYPRNDVLKSVFHYDNASFSEFLLKKNFFIASESISNYPVTELSLWSCLNTAYINQKIRSFEWSKSFVFEFFRKKGYKLIENFSDGSMTIDEKSVENKRLRSLHGHFSQLMLSFTPLAAFYSETSNQRSFVLKSLQNINKAIGMKGPKFVFSHIGCPHGPFVFGPNGEERELPIFVAIPALSMIFKEEAIHAFLDQITFINRELAKIIESICSRSEESIILLVSDHGPAKSLYRGILWKGNYSNLELKQLFGNLGAYRLDATGRKLLNSKISLVNIFRILFNSTFGETLPMHEDKAFFLLPWMDPPGAEMTLQE